MGNRLGVWLALGALMVVGCSVGPQGARVKETESFSASAIRAGKHKGDYLPAHNFKIEIDGVIVGGFKEVVGLESEIEIIEYRDGDDAILHRRPGRPKYRNIVFRRGFVTDPRMVEWYQRLQSGSTERKSISVICRIREGGELMRVNLYEAWPSRWKAPELNHAGVVEEIEFVVERIERS